MYWIYKHRKLRYHETQMHRHKSTCMLKTAQYWNTNTVSSTITTHTIYMCQHKSTTVPKTAVCSNTNNENCTMQHKYTDINQQLCQRLQYAQIQTLKAAQWNTNTQTQINNCAKDYSMLKYKHWKLWPNYRESRHCSFVAVVVHLFFRGEHG